MGAVVTWQDGAVVITSINPLGPAAATGEVLVGDHIMSVGAVAVSSVEQARALILGPSEQPPAIAHMAACSSVHYTNCFACFLFTAFPLFLSHKLSLILFLQPEANSLSSSSATSPAKTSTRFTF